MRLVVYLASFLFIGHWHCIAVYGLLEGLYCGVENCYDVLGVTRESTKSEISKAYRSLARKFHPDVQGPDVTKEEAENNFRRIATAYEVLRDEASREDYDYMVDNPDAYYAHYYRYYRRRTAPNIDVRLILGVMITLISGIQYYSSWEKYESAIKYLATVPKYRLRAVEIAKQEKMYSETSKKVKDKAKDREEKELIIRKVIEEKMDIRGGYAKPNWRDVLWVQLIISPYSLYCYLSWYMLWVYKFQICKEEYGDEEKLYLIKKYLKLSNMEFDALEDDTKAEYIELELWQKSKALEWKTEKEEEAKRELSQSARYKAYRRYMKKGPGRLTFDDS